VANVATRNAAAASSCVLCCTQDIDWPTDLSEVMYAGAVTQATDRSESLYKLHVKASAASQLPVGRVRNALPEASASLVASMTALSINTRKQVVSFGTHLNDMIKPKNPFMEYSYYIHTGRLVHTQFVDALFTPSFCRANIACAAAD